MQMFSDAQEVEESLQAYQRAVDCSQREQSMSEESDGHNQKEEASLNFEQRLDNFLHVLEVFNAHGFA